MSIVYDFYIVNTPVTLSFNGFSRLAGTAASLSNNLFVKTPLVSARGDRSHVSLVGN